MKIEATRDDPMEKGKAFLCIYPTEEIIPLPQPGCALPPGLDEGDPWCGFVISTDGWGSALLPHGLDIRTSATEIETVTAMCASMSSRNHLIGFDHRDIYAAAGVEGMDFRSNVRLDVPPRIGIGRAVVVETVAQHTEDAVQKVGLAIAGLRKTGHGRGLFLHATIADDDRGTSDRFNLGSFDDFLRAVACGDWPNAVIAALAIREPRSTVTLVGFA